MKPDLPTSDLDFALLQPSVSHTSGQQRRMLALLIALLVLAAASIVALVLYLQTFEHEELERQQVADAQWLERTVRFHFRRLEEDLDAMAHRATETHVSEAAQTLPSPVKGSLLWNDPAVLLDHGWLPAHGEAAVPIQQSLDQYASAARENAANLQIMLDISRGLRRASYAGPMRHPDGQPSDVLWLALPVFERGQYLGAYLVTLSLDQAINAMVPAWFRETHRLYRSDLSDGDPHHANIEYIHQAQLDLPGTDLALHVEALATSPPLLPRLFFLVAVLFLLGMLLSLWALSRDMRKRQQVENQLQAQVNLRTAMENSTTIGLRAWDLKGRILYVNRAFCELVGFEPAELIGRSAPLPYWPAHMVDELALVHHDILSQGTETLGVETQFQHRDGLLVDVLIHEAPLHSAHGQQLGWMSSVLDISERKRAERLAAQRHEKLEAMGRLVAMGEMASTLAHELNQPLGALSGFANGLLNRLDAGNIGTEEVRTVVGRIEQLAEKAGRIIQRVNAFAHQREMLASPLELQGFLRQALLPFQRQPGIQWEERLPPPRIWVSADAELLELAIRNVLGNACDWASRGHPPCRIRVQTITQGSRVGLQVADSGPGVTEEQRDLIFSAFYSAREGGMGMGLAICRSIVEAHRGQMEIGRDPELGGALFTLWLPLEDNPLPETQHRMDEQP